MKRRATIVGSVLGAIGAAGAVAWTLAKRAAQRAQDKLEEMRLQQHEIEVLEGEGGIVRR